MRFFTVWCQGVPSLDWSQGALALSLAVCPVMVLWWCALAVGVAVGSLHDDEPMQADEPLIVRGDAPRGLLLLAGKNCNRPMGLNVLGG